MKRRLLTTLSVMAVAFTAGPGAALAAADGTADGTPAAELAATGSVEKSIGSGYEPPGLTPTVRAMMRVQEGLDKVAQAIRTAAAKESPASGLAGVVVDAGANGVKLYWHGALPAAVSTVVNSARTNGTRVTTYPAPYSEAELTAESARISGAVQSAAAPAQRRAVSLRPRVDGTGLDVGVSGLPAGTTGAQARRLMPELASSVPVTITVGAEVVPATRFRDSVPYWGGTLIQRFGEEGFIGPSCSSGFGVRGNNGAATYLLTAAHCGQGEWRSGGIRRPDGTLDTIRYGATIATRDLGRDGAAILTPAGSGPGVYFGASFNPDTGSQGAGTGMAVGDAGANHVGDVLCTSGAFSGTICGLQVTGFGRIAFNPPIEGVGVMPNMVNAQTIDIAGAGNGDSGGPVFALRSDNRVSARGIISAIDTGDGHERPCQGYAPAGRRCSNSVWYGDVRGIMNTIGVQILTA